jgi:hypothetical protein
MRRLLLAIALIGLCLLAAPQPVKAYSFFGGVDCNQASSSTVCSDQGDGSNPISGSNGLLLKITNIVAYVGGAAAIVVIVIGAIRYITSGSDVSVGNRIDDDVLNAKRSIVGALVGLAIIVLAKVIITYVIIKLS